MSTQGPLHEPGGADLPTRATLEAAELRRRLDAQEASARRLEVPGAAAIGVVGLVVAAGGATHPALLAVGAWIVALAVLILWGRSVRNGRERGTGPRGPAPRLTTLDGEPATALTSPASHLAVTLAMWSLIAVPLVASGMALIVGGAPGPGVLLLAGGVVWLVPVGLAGAGRMSPGGLWLTPSAVVVRDHGLESRVPWVSLATVADGAGTDTADGTLVLRASATGGTIHRSRSHPWPTSARTAGPTIAVLDARGLAHDASAIAAVLRHYQRAGTTAELGTATSLRTVEAITGSPPASPAGR